MSRNFSIAISAKDNFSQAITTMRNANSSFNKDLTGTSQKLDALNKNKVILKVDTDDAEKSLKRAQKQFKRTRSAADKMALELAGAKYDNAKRNLGLVSKNAQQAEKSILKMTDAVSKADNRASRGSALTGTVSALAKAGFTKMAGDAVSQIANTAIGSAFGSDTGTMFGNVLSSAASGAAMGGLATGPMGTAIGAAVGAGIGLANGATENTKKKDDAFKSTVQNTYNSIKSHEANSLSSGITIASEREDNLRAFTTLLDGNTESADKFQNSLIEIGRTPPFSYSLVSRMSKEMLGLGDDTDTVLGKINSLAEVAAAEGMSESTVSSINAVLNQTLASGAASSRVIRTLSRYGINPTEAIAKAFNIKKSDVISKIGKLDATKVVNTVYHYMETDPKFKGASRSMTSTFKAQMGIKQSLKEDQQAAMGKGFEDTRVPALEKSNSIMSGKTGKGIKRTYFMVGAFKANLENTKEELKDNARITMASGTLTGDWKNDKNKKRLQELADDYKKQDKAFQAGNKDAGVQAGNDMAEAMVIAENEYKASKGYQLEVESEKSMVENIRNDMVNDKVYWNFGYEMGIETSKGIMATKLIRNKAFLPPDTHNSSGIAGTSKDSNSSGFAGMVGIQNNSHHSGFAGMGGYATGIFRVPYNNYPALLHEGETVNTAVEARSKKTGGPVFNNYGPITVRKDGDIDNLARAFAEKLSKAALVTP